MPIVIVEGPDLAGKTTLIGELQKFHLQAESHTTQVYHAKPPVHHPLDEYVIPLLNHDSDEPGDLVLCDRWHIGETVYPRVLRRLTQMDDAVRRYVDLFLRSRGVVTLVLDEPNEVLHWNYARRGDDVHRWTVIEQIADGYRAEVGTYASPHGFVLRTSSAIASVTKILDEANFHAARAAPLRRFTTYVGPRSPDVLLLGDKRHYVGKNFERIHRSDLPAFMPYPATSGHFLLKHLDTTGRVGAYGQKIGIANACDVDDPVELWETLDKPRVVALGALAAHQLKDLRVPFSFGSVPHPQFIRRFHYSAGSLYAGLIHTVAMSDDTRDELSWRP